MVTPPVVTLMLSVSDKALAGNLATSGATTKTKPTTSACTTSKIYETICPETTGTATTYTTMCTRVTKTVTSCPAPA